MTWNITQYLESERLIEIKGVPDGTSITHYGVRMIEEALSDPNKPTYYFPPANFIYVGQMINSQIQQASPGAAQAVTISENKYDELRKIIQSLKESIDQLGLQPHQKSELQSEITTIEVQMSSSKPKPTIITECLKSVRNILEGAAGSVLAAGLLSKIAQLLGG